MKTKAPTDLMKRTQIIEDVRASLKLKPNASIHEILAEAAAHFAHSRVDAAQIAKDAALFEAGWIAYYLHRAYGQCRSECA